MRRFCDCDGLTLSFSKGEARLGISRQWVRASVGWVLLAFAAILLGAAPARAREPTDDQLLRHFDAVAFGSEYAGAPIGFVRKWKRPIVIGVQGEPPPYFEDFVRQHAADLAKITGHRIEYGYSPAMEREKRLRPGFDRRSINVFLMYFPLDRMAAVLPKNFGADRDRMLAMLRSGQTTCMAKLFKKGNEIRAAVILFPAHHSRAILRACVVEELTQIMGLANDSTVVHDSIFNDRSPFTELTKYDRLLLRILYDRRIAIGMPRRNALDLARAMIAEFRPGR